MPRQSVRTDLEKNICFNLPKICSCQAHLQHILPQAFQSQRHCSYWWIIKGIVHLKFELTHHCVVPNLLTIFFHALLKNCHEALHKMFKKWHKKNIRPKYYKRGPYNLCSIFQIFWSHMTGLCDASVCDCAHFILHLQNTGHSLPITFQVCVRK